MRQRTNSVLGKLDDVAGIAEVLLDRGSAVKNRAVDEDAHLISTEVEEDLKTVDGARRGLRRGGCGELKLGWNGLLPLNNLVVEVANFFDVEGWRWSWSEGAD